MRSRLVVVFLVFAGLWTFMVSKAAMVQIFPNQRLGQLRQRQFKKVVRLKARRGAILDRNQKELAITIPAHSLYVDPQRVDSPKKLARQLARVLKLSSKKIYKKIKNKKRRFVWIKRQLDESEYYRVRDLKKKGIGFIEESRRVYPNQNLLSNLIGFVGIDDKGLEGLELKYDHVLRGENRKLDMKKDALGRPLLKDGRLFTDHPDGSTLHLTVDAELQYLLERELNASVDRYDADSAVGVILDVETSDVIAMANSPGYDLNRARHYVSRLRRNRAVTDAFEPGSTMKTFIVASALEANLVKPSTKINCEGGKFRIGRHVIGEADEKHSFKSLSVADILAKSSNIGATKLAFMLNAKRTRTALVNFGFGQKTKVDLPGETSGILHKTPWNPHLLSNVSFGHGLTVTPLQIANAYAAIANGGVLNQPRVVHRVLNREQGLDQNIERPEGRRVLSQDTAKTMRLLLGNVTARDSVSSARVSGYPVAGKTGTAQKVNPHGRGYLAGQYISSFAGFLPTNNPKYVIYVAVDNPKKMYYGSQVAAPIFSKVASYAMRRANIPPVIIKNKDLVLDTTQNLKMANAIAKVKTHEILKSDDGDRMPSLVGLTLREAIQRVAGHRIKIHGQGRVAKTWPAAGDVLKSRHRVVLRLNK